MLPHSVMSEYLPVPDWTFRKKTLGLFHSLHFFWISSFSKKFIRNIAVFATLKKDMGSRECLEYYENYWLVNQVEDKGVPSKESNTFL